MSYGPSRYPLRSCGKRHGWCKVCRPELMVGRTKQGSKGKWKKGYDPDKLAPGYVPHPTKTMWERHVDVHNVEEKYVPSVRIDLGESAHIHRRQQPPDDLKPVDQVIAEVEAGRAFTNAELRYHFNFSTLMINRFRAEQLVRERWNKRTDKEKKDATEKQKLLIKREERIIELRLDMQMTYEEIGTIENITRERVRQILRNAQIKYGVTFPKYVTRGMDEEKEKSLMIAVHCKVCGLVSEVQEHEKDKWVKQFCDEHRMTKVGYKCYLLGAEWWKMTPLERNRFRYKYDMEKRAKVIKTNLNWKNKIQKSDPVKWARYKAKQNLAIARYQARLKEKNKFVPRTFIEVPDHEE